MERKSVLFTQSALDDLIKDLSLSKEKLLASRSKQRNMVSPEVKVTAYKILEKFGEPYDPF